MKQFGDEYNLKNMIGTGMEEVKELLCTVKSVNFHHWSCLDHITKNGRQDLNKLVQIQQDRSSSCCHSDCRNLRHYKCLQYKHAQFFKYKQLTLIFKFMELLQ